MTAELLDTKPKRRDKLVIMMEIIDIAKKGTTKTHIMLKANLSFSQLNGYLEFLTESNLLQTSLCEGKVVYEPTQKGLEFMAKQQQIIGMLNEGGRRKCIKFSSFYGGSFQKSKSFVCLS